MQTSTIAQGPLGLGGRYITIGSTIYNLQAGDNPESYPAELRAFLEEEQIIAESERMFAEQQGKALEKLRGKLRTKNKGMWFKAKSILGLK